MIPPEAGKSSTHVKSFKHEVRTPLNHMLGYSALLLDIAEDAHDLTAAREAEKINRYARDLVRSAELILQQIDSVFDNLSNSNLCSELTRDIEVFTRHLATDSTLQRRSIYENDLKRIQTAAFRLQGLLERTSFDAAQIDSNI